MSLVQHFDHAPVAGFSTPRFAAQAHRQFQLSLGLVVILAVAAAGLSVSLWMEAPQAANFLAQVASIQ